MTTPIVGKIHLHGKTREELITTLRAMSVTLPYGLNGFPREFLVGTLVGQVGFHRDAGLGLLTGVPLDALLEEKEAAACGLIGLRKSDRQPYVSGFMGAPALERTKVVVVADYGGEIELRVVRSTDPVFMQAWDFRITPPHRVTQEAEEDWERWPMGWHR